MVVLDCFSEIFVWAGTLSTQTEKSWAMLKAEELSSRNRPACCDVTWHAADCLCCVCCGVCVLSVCCNTCAHALFVSQCVIMQVFVLSFCVPVRNISGGTCCAALVRLLSLT